MKTAISIILALVVAFVAAGLISDLLASVATAFPSA